MWCRCAVEASAGDAGGAFAPAVTLTTPGETGRLPGVGVDAAGAAVAAWYGAAVTIAERPAGGAFGAPRGISDPGGLPQVANLGAPEIALADGGRAVAAWRRGAGGSLRVEAAVRPAGSDWTAPTVLSPPAARSAGRPALDLTAAGHAAGRAVLAWREDPVGGPGRFFRAAIRFSPG